jgi:Mor family transcriptional regulator
MRCSIDLHYYDVLVKQIEDKKKNNKIKKQLITDYINNINIYDLMKKYHLTEKYITKVITQKEHYI